MSHPHEQDQILASVPCPERNLVAECAETVPVRAGEFLCQAASPTDWVFIIRRGLIAVQGLAAKRSSMPSQVMGPSRTIGLQSRIAGMSYRVTARAVTPAEVVRINVHMLEERLGNDPEAVRAVYRILYAAFDPYAPRPLPLTATD